MDQESEQQNTPLFQNADEQERLYAPEQVPGDARVAADEAGTAEEHVDDGSGTPIVPAAPTTTITTPELTQAASASITTNNVNSERNDQ